MKGTSRSPSSPGQTFTKSVRKLMSRMWIFKSSPVRRPVERRRDRIARSRRERRSSPVTAERRAFCSLSVRGSGPPSSQHLFQPLPLRGSQRGLRRAFPPQQGTQRSRAGRRPPGGSRSLTRDAFEAQKFRLRFFYIILFVFIC